MSIGIERLAKDLKQNPELCRELNEFDGTVEQLAGWLNQRGHQLTVDELTGIAPGIGEGSIQDLADGEELSDDDLDHVAGGFQMNMRSSHLSMVSNIMKMAQDGTGANIKNLR